VNDVGRYRKLYLRLWRHPGFTALTDGEKILALYVISGTQTNRLGLYVFSIATAAEELGTLPQTLKKRLVRVCQTFGWLFDSKARVIYIPSWFKWNPPDNVNVMKGSLRDLNEIPPCGLVDAFARNLETLPQTLHETFIEGLRQRLTTGIRIQDQYQEQKQKQNQKTVLRTGADTTLRGVVSAPLKHTTDQSENGPEEKLLNAARQVLRLTDPNAEMEHLLDALSSFYGRVDYPKASAIHALNIALSERRTGT